LTLFEQRAVLWEYLRLMVEMRDMHGIRDACVDIEKIDAKIEALNARPATD
jgi:hypothetical protein